MKLRKIKGKKGFTAIETLLMLIAMLAVVGMVIYFLMGFAPSPEDIVIKNTDVGFGITWGKGHGSPTVRALVNGKLPYEYDVYMVVEDPTTHKSMSTEGPRVYYESVIRNEMPIVWKALSVPERLLPGRRPDGSWNRGISLEDFEPVRVAPGVDAFYVGAGYFWWLQKGYGKPEDITSIADWLGK